jgi:CheY-like chemotaxis protein
MIMFERKILVVDDEEELLGLIDKSLTAEGYDVTTVTTAGSAMDKARDIVPDLILMDIVLPDMEGSEAVRCLMDDPLTRNIPVIFLSGIVTRDEEEIAASSIQVGGKAFKALSKPFSSKELMVEVRKAIG